MKRLGLIYFLYLFIYSGLEFTITFLMYHKLNYTSIDQAKMFVTTGVVMALLQGSVVRRLPAAYVKSSAVFGLYLIVPAFILVGFATNGKLLYAGMILFAICMYRECCVFKCVLKWLEIMFFFIKLSVYFSNGICGNMHDDINLRIWQSGSKRHHSWYIPITWCLGSSARTNICINW